MGNKKPKFKIGDRVRVLSLEEAIKIINGENSLCQPQSNE